MKDIYVITEQLKLMGKGQVYTCINLSNLQTKKIEKEDVDESLVIDFNDLCGHFSLYSDYPKAKKISLIKEIIIELKSSKIYKNSETLVSDIKDTLKLRNSNFQASMNRNNFTLISFK